MNRKLLLFLIILLMASASPAFAQNDVFASAPTADELGENVNSTIEVFWVVVQAVLAFVGFVLCAKGLYGFYQASDANNGGRASIGKSVVAVVMGAMLVLLPLTVGTLGKSIFGEDASRPQRIELTPE